MKLIFKQTGENVRIHNISTNGYEFIGTVESEDDFFKKIMELEADNYFLQEDGRVLSSTGNEVYDPKYPDSFDDCNYRYYLENACQLSPDLYKIDEIRLMAIKEANPYNLEEIIEKINK